MIKKWLLKHKTLLISFSITSIIFAIVTGYQVTLLLDNIQDLQYYAKTGEITDEMYSYGIVGGLNLLIGILWIVQFLFLLWKVIFPDYRTVKNAFFLNELEFLIKMPTNVRKELNKK